MTSSKITVSSWWHFFKYVTVSSWWHFFKYVVFLEGQAYFTYGDLHSSGLNVVTFENHKIVIFKKDYKTFTQNHTLCGPPSSWGHEACRWSLKPKPPPLLVSSDYPKLILRGEVCLSPPPYSRARNLMLSPKARLQILTFFIFEKY